jgi:hypothetical protein
VTSTDQPEAQENRLKIATRIVELSNQRLSTHPNPKYIALKIGSGPYSNAFAVRNDRISCFIHSTDLLNRIKSAGFNPREAPKTTPMNEHKFYFSGSDMKNIQNHGELLREVVNESVATIIDRRPRKK